MAGTPELHKALQTAWDDASLGTHFKNYWAAGDRDFNLALHDTEAAPGSPFPYCVYEISNAAVTTRMSYDTHLKYMILDIPLLFKIFTKQTTEYSAKTIAANLVEEILKKFGGHPDPANVPIEINPSGQGFLITQYVTDYGMRVGDEQYLWVIEYLVRLDVPTAV